MTHCPKNHAPTIKPKESVARGQTDVRDTFILARLLAANLVPEVWVPPQHVRELRQFLSPRRQLVETHTQLVNRMHSVAHRHHLQHERGKRFNEKNTGWQKNKQLSKIEQFQLELELENRAYLEKQISRIGREVAKMSHQQPWADGMTYLMRLGVGRDLIRITLNPKYPRKLASEAELLALRPELNHLE